jgi:NAD(P)-dependent dehydrogenase (short-subunit alcohol dehydrogenase family)
LADWNYEKQIGAVGQVRDIRHPIGIQVDALAPGFIETDLTESMKTTPVYQEVIARNPAGRWAHPDECAGAARVSGFPCFGFRHRVNPSS